MYRRYPAGGVQDGRLRNLGTPDLMFRIRLSRDLFYAQLERLPPGSRPLFGGAERLDEEVERLRVLEQRSESTVMHPSKNAAGSEIPSAWETTS